MRYRFKHDAGLLSRAHLAAVRTEMARRYGGHLLAVATRGLHLPAGIAEKLVTRTLDEIGSDRAVRDALAQSRLPPPLATACLLADCWPRLAAADGLELAEISTAIKKKTVIRQSLPGLVTLVEELRTLARQSAEEQFMLRLGRPGIAALKPGDLALLLKRFDNSPARVLEALALVYDAAPCGQSLLEGFLLEVSLEAHRAILAAEEHEHCIDFNMLERFADTEKQRQTFFAACLPERIPVLGPDVLFGLTGVDEPVPDLPEMGGSAPDEGPEIRYARRAETVLAAERLLLVSREPGPACASHLETARIVHSGESCTELFRHAGKCERCAAILGLVLFMPHLRMASPGRALTRRLAGMSRA